MVSSLTNELPQKPILIIPEVDVADPEVTILVPSMNEEITIATFCAWCHIGFERAKVVGEILIVDSSSDSTPDIARENGARILRVPSRGLGHAYKDALPFIRGKFVILGDADCTYDFRDIAGFLNELRSGADFVMGSRFRGEMDRRAMPLHHKYFGSPLTTLLADVLLGIRLTDIHCGMRGFTRDALLNLGLKSNGWEYASEMIVNSVRSNYRMTEIPIPFYRDNDDRLSHLKRQGWLSPFRAGWRTVRVLLTNAADFFLIPPGIMLSVVGTFILLSLAPGPLRVANTTFTLNTAMIGLGLASLGYFLTAFGIVTRCIYDRTNGTVLKWFRRLPFNRTMLSCFVIALLGLSAILIFVGHWVTNDRQLSTTTVGLSHLATLGLGAILLSSSVFVTMLLVTVLANDRE